MPATKRSARVASSWTAPLIAIGIDPFGKRCVLGVSVALSEAEVHWCNFLSSPQSRGPHGLTLIVSDAHAGLGAARAAVFPSVPWQRCQFHLQQNAQAYVPRLDLRSKAAADICFASLTPAGQSSTGCLAPLG